MEMPPSWRIFRLSLTGVFHNDSFRWSQWRKLRHNDHKSVLVFRKTSWLYKSNESLWMIDLLTFVLSKFHWRRTAAGQIKLFQWCDFHLGISNQINMRLVWHTWSLLMYNACQYAGEESTRERFSLIICLVWQRSRYKLARQWVQDNSYIVLADISFNIWMELYKFNIHFWSCCILLQK